MRAETLESTIIFRATPDLCAEVREAAERERVTVSEFVRRAVAAMTSHNRQPDAVAGQLR